MIYPEGTKVVVKPDLAQDMTKGGLFIPETVRDKQQLAITRGEIVALGPKAEVRFCDTGDATGISTREARPGDRCIFVKYAGASLRWGKTEYRILQDVDIVCYIDNEEEDEMPDTRKPMVK